MGWRGLGLRYAPRMDAQTHCRERASLPGSALHYALLFEPADSARALRALAAFRRETHDLLGLQPEPARARIGYWYQELALSSGAAARHPVTSELAWSQARFGLDLAPLAEVLQASQLQLDGIGFADEAALRTHLYGSAGVLGRLAGQIGSATDAEAHALMAQALERTAWVRGMGRALRRGQCPIADADLAQCGLTSASLLAEQGDDARLDELVRLQVGHARSLLAAARGALPAGRGPDTRALRALAAMSDRLLDELERAGRQVFHAHIRLGPLVKLMCAWRARR